MSVFKVTRETQKQVLKDFIYTTIFYLCFALFISLYLVFESDFIFQEIVLVLLLGFLPYAYFFLYPVLTIHLNYLKHAVYQTVVLSDSTIQLDNMIYKSDSILKIDVYGSHVYFAGGSGTTWSSHEVAYYRIEFHLDNSQKICLTSLYGKDLYPSIKECFVGTTILEHKLLFVPSYWI